MEITIDSAFTILQNHKQKRPLKKGSSGGVHNDKIIAGGSLYSNSDGLLGVFS